MREFAGRGALITGGASGIGLALAHALAKRGMRIVVCDRDGATLRAAADELRAAGATALPLVLDVTDRIAWSEAVSRTRSFGPLHVVCANAGIAPGGAPLSILTPDAWDRIVAVNLTGVFNTVHATAPLLREHRQGGHYVLTSSMAGMIAASPIGDYAATKFGVSALGEALRAELAPEGIGVSVLYPGVVATPLVGESRSLGMSPDSVALRVIQAIEADELFIFTHGDYRPLVKARMAAILSGFGPTAQAGFAEDPGVLGMMKSTPYPPGGVKGSGRGRRALDMERLAMDDVKRLLAIEEIRQLKARYYRCMDTKDWEGLGLVFAPDAVFDLREVNSVRHPLTGEWTPHGDDRVVYRGHAAVLKMIRDAVTRLVTVHHGHMGEIEVTSDDTAKAIWAMEDVIRSAPGEPEMFMHGFGHYHDTYVRLDRGWAIRTTRITRLYLERA